MVESSRLRVGKVIFVVSTKDPDGTTMPRAAYTSFSEAVAQHLDGDWHKDKDFPADVEHSIWWRREGDKLTYDMVWWRREGDKLTYDMVMISRLELR